MGGMARPAADHPVRHAGQGAPVISQDPPAIHGSFLRRRPGIGPIPAPLLHHPHRRNLRDGPFRFQAQHFHPEENPIAKLHRSNGLRAGLVQCPLPLLRPSTNVVSMSILKYKYISD